MKIVLTGGGTSGHVTPNIALIPKLKEKGFNEISYIGTKTGVEKGLIEKENIPFYEIEAGKLRRYLDIQNVKDIAKICKGYNKAKKILKQLKPDVVFSKGGFVSCPVVWAASKLRIPVILHESDLTPGLANKLSLPFADKICCSFPETAEKIPEKKGIYTGLPIRKEIFEGNKSNGLKLMGFDGTKPILTVMGGSLGSEFLNNTVRSNLDELFKTFDICHLCGKGHIDRNMLNIQGYCQFEYVNEELPDIMAATDMIVSRAGATAIFEIASLNKPALLVPLSKKASRGDQIDNAKSFKNSGILDYIEEEDIIPSKFASKILEIYTNKEKYINTKSESNDLKSSEKIVDIIISVIKR